MVLVETPNLAQRARNPPEQQTEYQKVRFLPDLSQSSVVVLAISWNWTEPGKRGFFPDTYPLPGSFPGVSMTGD
ncbi:hypothetical protein ATANTOWER_006121 [Ataeniobius toweri]|uniref:Uncharacterized protein n=1 Tax=Ataeniobius toweri TaxID=208326 RepID=A0ABU7CI12_9TELE|nr:hypothetical protein [Ataeniobius toweri]